MDEQVSVEVSGIEFAAGHFVSEGGKCERLHGHNYGVTAKIHGKVDEHGMIIDFRVLKKLLRELCNSWDHRILLPSTSPQIQVVNEGEQTTVKTPDGNYVLPTRDVIKLDVVETTTEELARILCRRLVQELKSRYQNLQQVSVKVSESATSHATVTIHL